MNQQYNYDKEDPHFVKDLNNSKQFVYRTAEWLNGKGYPVTINPTIIRPDSSMKNDYGDNGDLTVSFTIEVKQRPNMNFTSRADFPYPTVIVDACHIFDAHKGAKPYTYFIWNSQGTAFILVDVLKTSKKWIKTTKRDRYKNRDRHFYECPIELVSFHIPE